MFQFWWALQYTLFQQVYDKFFSIHELSVFYDHGDHCDHNNDDHNDLIHQDDDDDDVDSGSEVGVQFFAGSTFEFQIHMSLNTPTKFSTHSIHSRLKDTHSEYRYRKYIIIKL